MRLIIRICPNRPVRYLSRMRVPIAYIDAPLQPPPMKLAADLKAVKTWVYPLNMPKRDYQFNIVQKCLLENTLVALPTGLGKTFIAGAVMLNCTLLITCVSLRANLSSQFIAGSLPERSSSLHPRNRSSLSRSRPATELVGYPGAMPLS